MVLMRSVVKYLVGAVLAILLAGGAFHAGMLYNAAKCFNYVEYQAQFEPMVLEYDTTLGYDHMKCNIPNYPPVPTIGPVAGTRG